ncbi:MAG: thiol-disulfide oxidoreductase YkuV [Chloroflexota bacterium]|nr:MAG: thiol-disulfide oxidoreductase YkuV [Chloroflexota bacterium]
MSLRLNTPLPDFSGATAWINGPLDRASLSGHPVLIHFWSVSSYLSHENMPQVTAWRDTYGPQGLKLIAIHVPQQTEDTRLEWVRQIAAALWITEPCGVDNRHLVKRAFANLYVPAYFLFDARGLLRVRTGGIAGLGLVEQALQRLLEPRERRITKTLEPLPGTTSHLRG